ncbi:MAG: hypothetical protein CVV42_19385 [Candidatus Riflebacteria bacterium HGW-Riflebacteria-2]|nr:MAG: hypothetical protein CVV42_19385 [Candidatus Riflebacteria bacterium HGW-Riflebacteria-2]
MIVAMLFPIIASGERLLERTGPACVPCNPETDFAEAFFIRDWNKLPHKNQEESQERVDEVNTFLTKKKWSYVKALPVLACLSFATSTVADWWAMEYGWDLPEYYNFYNGKSEHGFNPRELEVVYIKRSKESWTSYPMAPVPDLIHKRPFPAANPGYARLLTNQEEGKIDDTILPHITYYYTKDKYPFENKWLKFKRKLKSNSRYTKELIAAIHAHGPLLTQIEFSKFIRAVLPGVHGVVIVGYGKTEENPNDTVFILHDSYGDNPKEHGVRVNGGPSYKYVKAKYLHAALGFPHRPVLAADYNGGNVAVKVLNRAKKPLKVFKFAIWNCEKKKAVLIEADENGTFNFNPEKHSATNNGFISVYVAAEFYMESPGKGYWFKLKHQ